MLTHGDVKSLEQIEGIEVKVVPDTKSSSTPPNDSDETQYWYLYITLGDPSYNTFVAALYNEGNTQAPHQELIGTLCAFVRRGKPGSCDVTQKEIDLLTTALMELTDGEVYHQADEYTAKKLEATLSR